MKSLWKCLIHCGIGVSVSAGLMSGLFAQDSADAGIVRISKPRTSQLTGGQIIPVSVMQMSNSCTAAPACTATASEPALSCASPDASSCGMGGSMGCDSMSGGMMCDPTMGMGRGCYRGNCYGGRGSCYGGRGSCYGGHCRGTGCHGSNCGTGPTTREIVEYFKCKFGYFIPTGGGGAGVPVMGCYSRVYPVNPYYSDSRDGQAWAAQGYGISMAVPLAPVVGHTYNYGWGIPSSRLTPVSHPAY